MRHLLGKGSNKDEYRTYMSLWGLLAAPRLAGNDLSKKTPETLALLTDPEVSAVDQEPLGAHGPRWEKRDVGVFSSAFTAQVPTHGVVMIEVRL
jgi:alpha-galactosidase